MSKYATIETLKSLRYLTSLLFEDESELYRSNLSATLQSTDSPDKIIKLDSRAKFNIALEHINTGYILACMENAAGVVDLYDLVNSILAQLANPVPVSIEQLVMIFDPVRPYLLTNSPGHPYVYNVYFRHPVKPMDLYSIDAIIGVEYGIHEVIRVADPQEGGVDVLHRSFVLRNMVAVR